MTTEAPHIWLSYEGPLLPLLAEFSETVAADGLDLRVEQRPSTRAMAGVEWLMPTAIMVFVAKSYFDGFLGEMSKDHYHALRKALKALGERLSKVSVTRIGTLGKIAPAQPYSAVYSVWFGQEPDHRFKYLIPNDLPSAEAEAAMDVFLVFLEAYYTGALDAADGAQLADAKPIGRTVLLAYDPPTGKIKVIDPLPAHLRTRVD